MSVCVNSLLRRDPIKEQFKVQATNNSGLNQKINDQEQILLKQMKAEANESKTDLVNDMKSIWLLN